MLVEFVVAIGPVSYSPQIPIRCGLLSALCYKPLVRLRNNNISCYRVIVFIVADFEILLSQSSFITKSLSISNF